MRVAIAFVLLLLAAPLASATEPSNPDRAADDKPVNTEIVQAEADQPLQLESVQVEQSEVAEDGVAQDMPQRGSFWWIVGAIVVAGVILALVL
jgi:cytochrome c-type biogenesis protein CcmH/NrfG